jgi:hypothetical protein
MIDQACCTAHAHIPDYDFERVCQGSPKFYWRRSRA